MYATNTQKKMHNEFGLKNYYLQKNFKLSLELVKLNKFLVQT
jgi:hypothetical protein